MKKIIINGVDVSGCEYRDYSNRCRCDSSKENTGEERLTGHGGCAYNPNCHYKQLQREKQKVWELEEKNNRLYFRNSKLKNSINFLKKEFKSMAHENCLLRVDNNNNWLNLEEEIKEYKQALEEIKGMVETCQEIDFNECSNCKYYKECRTEDEFGSHTTDICTLILKKCEVLEDE